MQKTVLRRAATTLKRRVRETWADWRRQRGYSKPVAWENALVNDELSFWAKALADGGKNWNPAEFKERTDPAQPLQKELRELISTAPDQPVRILDVGSGPLTRIGSRWPGREVKITATDPLADQYNQLLKKLRIVQPVHVTFAHGEKLLQVFSPDYFDLAYASNALDHSYDPLKAIEQMLAVTKPGGYIYLWHFSNVAKQECFEGLHQWNFDIAKGDFVISNGTLTHSVSSHFGAAIHMKCETARAFDANVVIAKMKKTGLQ